MPIEGFSDGAHLGEADPKEFFRCVVSAPPEPPAIVRDARPPPSPAAHQGDEEKKEPEPPLAAAAAEDPAAKQRRQALERQAREMCYGDFAALGLLPEANRIGGAHRTSRVFEPRVVVRGALTPDERSAAAALRSAAARLAENPETLAAGLHGLARGDDAAPPPDVAALLRGGDGDAANDFEALPQAVRRGVASALARRCEGLAAYVLKELPSGGPARDEAIRTAHLEEAKASEDYDAQRTWSDTHRRLVKRVSLGMLENMDAAAREALLRPALDAYAGVQLKFEAVEGVRAGDCVGVCARCARVLTANRKCARCKVANYCSRAAPARLGFRIRGDPPDRPQRPGRSP